MGRDGIPSLTNPDLASADQDAFLKSTDRVLALERNGAARAYPLLVLWWHEMINDTLGGERVLVTYCPLTGSGLAFDPRVGGAPRSFGVSGLLFENNLVMYDRLTQSLWPQLLWSARCGPGRGTALVRIPLVETTWGEWKATHPTTTVVTTSTGYDRPYGLYPYGNYDVPNNRDLLYPSSPYSNARLPKELVLGVEEGSVTAAYPLSELDSLGGAAVAVNDTLAGRPIIVTYRPAARTAVAFDRRVGVDTLEFLVSARDSTLLEDRQTGSLWTTWGIAVAGPLQGTALRPLEDAYTLFWFAWSLFHPSTRLYR